MRMILAVALAATLAACAGAGNRPAPEPVIVTKQVLVEVVKPCPALEAVGPEPSYPDSDNALASAPNLFERVKLLLAGRVKRIARGIALNSALEACR